MCACTDHRHEVVRDTTTPPTTRPRSKDAKRGRAQPTDVLPACEDTMGENPAKFEEAWNAWEHQVAVYEKLTTSKLDGDDDVVKISVVLREAPTNLRDNLLVNSQHFESNYKKLRAIIQAYLSSNKSWHANDLRNDTKESDPMEVDHMGKGKGKDNSKGKSKNQSKGAKPDKQDK